MLKISIIIPVYNTPSDLLKRCLASIEDQNYSLYEIIIIDDGSKTDTAYFLDDIAELTVNCKVIHTVNQGVSAARNIGVKSSCGDYIMFVDADDVVAPCMLKEAVDTIKHTNADVCYGMVKYVKNNLDDIFSKRDDVLLIEKINTDDKKDTLIKQLISLGQKKYTENGLYLSRGPFARLVKHELAIETPFVKELKIGEDGLWNLQIAKKSTNAVVVKSCWYYYVKYDGSAVQRYRDDCEQYILCAQMHLEEMDNEMYRIPLLERTIDLFFEVMRSCYGHKNYPYTEYIANKECRNFIKSNSNYIKCGFFEFFKLRSKEKFKWLILQYCYYPVTAYKILKMLK